MVLMKFHSYRVHKDHRRAGAYDIVPGLPGDFNFTKHTPNVIPEELHMHKDQTDYFTVVTGKVMFRLVYDDGTPEEKVIVTEEDAKTVIVPPGVWHGYVALVPSVMAFYITHKYDDKDEFRRKSDPSEWQLPK